VTAASAPIEIHALRKVYNGVAAVDALSVRVEAGQIVGLVGPNGAGKTTTMRCAVGIVPPTAGAIRIGGHDLAAAPVAAKRTLAFVPDDPHLFDALTVWEHLEFTAAAYRIPDWEARARALLQQFELEARRNDPAQALSRGMRQKAAICCAYLHDPLAIFLDEPLTGLDPRGIRTMKDSLAARAAAGSAVVVSSHLLSLVEDLCTDVLLLHRGTLRFHGGFPAVREAMRQAGDANLEAFFFRLTEGPV
jgi:ABC-2 type transport system ATP-binding protein